MILAAGKGKRLRPITNRIPKPLVRINGIPILAYHFEKLYVAGFRQVFVNISYLGHLIMKEFGNSYKGLNIRYSLEPDPPLETAGGILFARPWDITNKPFLVINADVWCDWNVQNAERVIPRQLNDDGVDLDITPISCFFLHCCICAPYVFATSNGKSCWSEDVGTIT